MGPLELVAILATRWRHLPFASRTFCHHMMPHPLFAHFGHQMELLALIANLATRRHHLHQLQIGSPSGTTCIGSKFGHQLAPFALLPKLATRLHHCIATLPWIALLALSVSIELVSSSARVTSVKSYTTSWSDGQTSGPKDRTPPLHQGQLRGVVGNPTMWQEIPPHGKNPNNVVGFLTTWQELLPSGGNSCHMSPSVYGRKFYHFWIDARQESQELWNLVKSLDYTFIGKWKYYPLGKFFGVIKLSVEMEPSLEQHMPCN